MRFKLDEYLLIVILFLTIDNVNARVPTLEEIAANEEYRLKMDYKKKHVYL